PLRPPPSPTPFPYTTLFRSTLRRPAADDICYATQNRQDAVKRLAEEATLILVIGSQTSSNAQRLVEVARNAGAAAELIGGEEERSEEHTSELQSLAYLVCRL